MTPTLTMPTPAAEPATGLPDWLYRSEAFAEDLPAVDAPCRPALPAGSAGPARAPGALYIGTLALALVSLASLLPAALTGA